ncbi:MAG TPA: carbohydrate-binding family 9-like protein [Bryobacteraceae bacterium]|jgi:hypothetical protein|nr:carbohydrate-binding family 9-like protein [Bryobacteraceae bacterium]
MNKFLLTRVCCLVPILFGLNLRAQPACNADQPIPSFTIRHVSGDPDLNLDPDSAEWKAAASQSMSKDCRRQIDYPNIDTTIRAFWTDADLYILFRCPYSVLNVFPADNTQRHVGLWNRDAVEMFIGDDWTNIRHYREFEVAPTGDWINLAIDLDRKSYDYNWKSGWQKMARVDEGSKIWYAAAKIPLSDVSANPVRDGMKWRINFYRIDGLGPDTQRHFLCWSRTCGSNHVPERFGTLFFSK